jgi:hypothetical protein
MHDPWTVAHEIKAPWKKRYGKNDPATYHPALVTVWHVDPETDGTDDSCGWFSVHLTKPEQAHIREIVDWHDWYTRYGGEAANTAHELATRAYKDGRDSHHPRPWYRKPQWHVRHWHIIIEPWARFIRRFERCAVCGKRMGTATRMGNWSGDKVWHRGCEDHPPVAQ